MLLSVVIITKDRPIDLRKTLQSIGEQSRIIPAGSATEIGDN
jgi:hypothetical protein